MRQAYDLAPLLNMTASMENEAALKRHSATPMRLVDKRHSESSTTHTHLADVVEEVLGLGNRGNSNNQVVDALPPAAGFDYDAMAMPCGNKNTVDYT